MEVYLHSCRRSVHVENFKFYVIGVTSLAIGEMRNVCAIGWVQHYLGDVGVTRRMILRYLCGC